MFFSFSREKNDAQESMRDIDIGKVNESPNSKTPKRCPRCGNLGSPDAVYCEKCGVRLNMTPRANVDTEVTRKIPQTVSELFR